MSNLLIAEQLSEEFIQDMARWIAMSIKKGDKTNEDIKKANDTYIDSTNNICSNNKNK